jgi:hypothetical protein
MVGWILMMTHDDQELSPDFAIRNGDAGEGADNKERD